MFSEFYRNSINLGLLKLRLRLLSFKNQNGRPPNLQGFYELQKRALPQKNGSEATASFEER